MELKRINYEKKKNVLGMIRVEDSMSHIIKWTYKECQPDRA